MFTLTSDPIQASSHINTNVVTFRQREIHITEKPVKRENFSILTLLHVRFDKNNPEVIKI